MVLFATLVVLGIAAGCTRAPTAPTARARTPASSVPAAPAPDREISPEQPQVSPAPEAPARLPVPTSVPTSPPPRGILPMLGPSPFDTVEVLNQWRDQVDGEWLHVYAGGLWEDPEQGILIVFPFRPRGEYPTPLRAGPVTTIAAEGRRLTLAAMGGATFVFDVESRTYTTLAPPVSTLAVPALPGLLPREQATPSPGDTAAPWQPCRAADLDARIGWQRTSAAFQGLLRGRVLVTNRSATGCTVFGWPQTLHLLDAEGRALPAQRADLRNKLERVAMLAPGATAWMEVRWSNWCGPAPEGPLTLVMTLWEGRGEFRLPGPDGPPGCGEPTAPAWLGAGPFMPTTRPRAEASR